MIRRIIFGGAVRQGGPFAFVLAAATAILLAWVPAFAQQAADQQVPASRDQVKLTFAPLVRQAGPTVVNIYASKAVIDRGPGAALLNDPFFRQFFGGRLPFGEPRERIENSLGSGVVVRSDGLVVTNHHVIEGADTITVVLADRREFPATIVRDDQRTDLAVLRIDTGGEKLPAIGFSDPDELQVGDLVLAIGNPFGVGQTVTSGIVSALARTNVGITDFSFFIQTDAAINPGNSGGALIDMNGRLVGINTAIFSRTGGSQGIGFAVPVSMVRTVLAAVDAGGAVRRPWLGAAGQDVSADIAQAMRLETPRGALLTRVHADGPAARAGLRAGDVVVQFDGHMVDDFQSLLFRVATAPLGGTAAVVVRRAGGRATLALSLEPAPETPPRDETLLRGRHPFAGATVVNLSPAVGEELGLDPARQGVVVVDIAGDSPAARFGVQRLDQVVAVNGREIATVEDLRAATAQPQTLWKLAVRRGDRVLAVNIQG
ncbi:MAG: Do family serine endopeptidase [Alphaproteobacteria bacterium]